MKKHNTFDIDMNESVFEKILIFVNEKKLCRSSIKKFAKAVYF